MLEFLAERAFTKSVAAVTTGNSVLLQKMKFLRKLKYRFATIYDGYLCPACLGEMDVRCILAFKGVPFDELLMDSAVFVER